MSTSRRALGLLDNNASLPLQRSMKEDTRFLTLEPRLVKTQEPGSVWWIKTLHEFVLT